MENITDTSFHAGKDQYKKYFTRLMGEAVIDGRISERDRDQIRAFLSEVNACGKISSQRTYKLAYQLVGIRRWVPEFSSVDTSTLFSGIERLKSDSDYTESTQADMIKLAKRFLLWLHESGEASPGLKPDKLRKIQVKTVSATKTAEDILSPDQIDAIFKNVTTTRNRAMVELLYESAGRAGEIATLKWGDVTFYQTHASIRLDGKTGKIRQAPIYTSHIALRRWKDQYPGGDPGPDDLVFPARAGGSDPLTYGGTLKMVRKAAEKAGIEKSVTLHTFRHSRITHLLQAGMNESTIKLLAWGDVGSNMLKVYSHLTPGDVENSFNQLYGIKSVEEFRGMDPAVSPHQCPSCGMLNPPGNRFCGGCGNALIEEARDDLTASRKLIAEAAMGMDEEMMRKIILKMKESGEI